MLFWGGPFCLFCFYFFNDDDLDSFSCWRMFVVIMFDVSDDCSLIFGNLKFYILLSMMEMSL